MRKWKCPGCGNRAQQHIQDNLGKDYRQDHPDLTLLCVAPIEKGKTDSFGKESDGTLPCGYQWTPLYDEGV